MYAVGFVVGVVLFAVIAGVGRLHGERVEKKLERAVWVTLAGAVVGITLLGVIWVLAVGGDGGDVETTLETGKSIESAGGSYERSAKSLVLTATEAQYEARVKSLRVQQPQNEEAREGFVEGWRSAYADRSPVSTAEIDVYVYDDSDAAATALDIACTRCTESERLGPIDTRSGSGLAGDHPFVLAIAACGNVYMAVRTQGTQESVEKLTYNAGYLIAATYVEATRGGLPGCHP